MTLNIQVQVRHIRNYQLTQVYYSVFMQTTRQYPAEPPLFFNLSSYTDGLCMYRHLNRVSSCSAAPLSALTDCPVIWWRLANRPFVSAYST